LKRKVGKNKLGIILVLILILELIFNQNSDEMLTEKSLNVVPFSLSTQKARFFKLITNK